jgi:hypothetical protein
LPPGVAALPTLADEHGISEDMRERLIHDYEEHLALAEAKRTQSAALTDRQAEPCEAMVDRTH